MDQLASFQSALNALVYSNSSDNPLHGFTDADNTSYPQRLIEIRVTDNASTGDVNEARTVAKISVDIAATDDTADLQINDFERVQIAPLDPDTGLPSGELSVQPTQLLPASLFDQPETDAIASTIYGDTFDPDTLISKIKIDVTSVDASLVSAALGQDKLFFDTSRVGETTSFAVSAGDETASLTLTLDVTDQTLAENQAQVEAALRSVHFKNYEPLAELVSGYRDVKITFNDDATAVYDSSLDQQLAKLLVGKALQPGDTLYIPRGAPHVDRARARAAANCEAARHELWRFGSERTSRRNRRAADSAHRGGNGAGGGGGGAGDGGGGGGRGRCGGETGVKIAYLAFHESLYPSACSPGIRSGSAGASAPWSTPQLM